MDWLFRRHFWIVHVAGVVLCAALSALCVNVLVGYGLVKAFSVHDVQQPVGKPSDAPKEVRNFNIANERNLFGAKRESVSAIDANVDGMGHPSSGRWEDAVLSGLRVRLVGTAVFRDPIYSTALIEDQSQGGGAPAQVFSINECPQKPTSINSLIVSIMGPSVLAPIVPCNRLQNVAVIKRIEQGRVYLFNEQERRYEYIAMERAPLPPPPMIAPAPALGGKKEYGQSVRKTGPNSYEIDASDLDAALGDMASLMTQARMVPSFDENGKSVGFKVQSIRPGSVFEKIGLKDGDVISKLNGYEMNDPSKVLEVYGKLRSSSQVNLEVNGKTLEYSIVGGR